MDIAGGLVATLPSEKDLRHPEVGKYVEKYLKANASIPTEDRIRMMRLIENMALGVGMVESLHGRAHPKRKGSQSSDTLTWKRRRSFPKTWRVSKSRDCDWTQAETSHAA